MQDPTRDMRTEAASADFYESPWGQHPRLQLLTVEELLSGTRIDMPPPGASITFKRADKAEAPTPENEELFSGESRVDPAAEPSDQPGDPE